MWLGATRGFKLVAEFDGLSFAQVGSRAEKNGTNCGSGAACDDAGVSPPNGFWSWSYSMKSR
jgi:hypothetical protein